jgi:hypothetical protein
VIRLNRILPDAVTRPCHAQPLAPGSILSQIVHIVGISDAHDVWIGYAALIPASAGSGLEHRGRVLAPVLAVGRLRQADSRRGSRAGLIPVEELRAFDRDVRRSWPSSRPPRSGLGRRYLVFASESVVEMASVPLLPSKPE